VLRTHRSPSPRRHCYDPDYAVGLCCCHRGPPKPLCSCCAIVFYLHLLGRVVIALSVGACGQLLSRTFAIMGRVCTVCRASATPPWRSGQEGETLCNACGLRERHGNRAVRASGPSAPLTRSGIRRSTRRGGRRHQLAARLGRFDRVRSPSLSASSSHSAAPKRSRVLIPHPPPSDTTTSSTSSGSPRTVRPPAGTAQLAATPSPIAAPSTLVVPAERMGAAAVVASSRGLFASAPAPAALSPALSQQWGPATTRAGAPVVASFADRAAAAIALTRRAASCGRVLGPTFPVPLSAVRPSSMHQALPLAGPPLPMATTAALPPLREWESRVSAAATGRQPALLLSAEWCPTSKAPGAGAQWTAEAFRAPVEGTHELAGAPPGQADRHAAGRPFLKTGGCRPPPVAAHVYSTYPPALAGVAPSPLPTGADDFSGAPSPSAFRSFTPHEVGAAIAAYARALLTPGRKLELTVTFTMGAIEGNIVGIVVVEEDIQLITAALLTFYRRNHRGDIPYATECRVLRFLRRMR